MTVIQLHARRPARVPPFVSYSRAANHTADPRADLADLARAAAEWECPIALDVETLPEVEPASFDGDILAGLSNFQLTLMAIGWLCALVVAVFLLP